MIDVVVARREDGSEITVAVSEDLLDRARMAVKRQAINYTPERLVELREIESSVDGGVLIGKWK